MNIREAYVSYTATDFDATSRFYEHVLGLERVTGWDRPDGRGAYFGRNGVGVVEISDAASGGAPTAFEGVAVTIMVDDLDGALSQIDAGAGISPLPIVDKEWGRFAELRDPDGVLVNVMERLGTSAEHAKAFLDRSASRPG